MNTRSESVTKGYSVIYRSATYIADMDDNELAILRDLDKISNV
jgi:hypothetical protein